MPLRTIPFVLLAIFTVTVPARGQGNLTGTISGQIVGQDGSGLPGVTVSATSPALQGARVATSSANGDYILAFLPLGAYEVVYQLDGFKTVKQTATVVAGQTIALNATLELSGVTELVQVVGTTSEVLTQGPTAATTFKQSLVDELPLNRGIDATTALAPGVLRTGPPNATTGAQPFSISGAISTENVVLLNGVVVQDNVRRTSTSLFIEDALQETTVSTAGVSAEYGRFAGGVVNAVTKSGGNTFSGSFRTTFENDDWRSLTPFTGDTKADKTVPTYEYTAGGPILRDRLWFFTAGRLVDETAARNTFAPARIAYERSLKERRYEGKLTYGPFTGHTVRAAYLNRKTEAINDNFLNEIDLVSLTNREDPQDTRSFNWTGIFGNELFVEAQYSAKNSSIVGSGSRFTDLIQGTLIVDGVTGGRFNSPTFCGICRPEERDNSDLLVKASYFLSSDRLGSHNLVAGYDLFRDLMVSENHQSGSGYRVIATSSIVRDGQVYPVLNNIGSSTILRYNPIQNASKGSDFRTHSVFVNDVWRLNGRFTFNVGLRFDKNQGVDSADAKVVDDAKFSPRLAMTWDPSGAGRWTVNASYATYVAAVVNTIANSGSNAGSPARFDWQYLGPAINLDPTVPLVSSAQALQTMFDWFFANGGTDRRAVVTQLPGVNTRIGSTLASPAVDEIAGSVTRRLGERGLLRVDAVYRNFGDFYATRVDGSTGQVTNDLGQSFDLRIIENSNAIEREYAGLSTTLTYRQGARLNLGATYTLSRTWGSIDGETSNAGPVTVGPQFFPEYIEGEWNFPVGDLGTDQRHKTRIWATYQVPVPARLGMVTAALLQSVDSGTPYGAITTIDPSRYVTGAPAYVSPPTSVNYFFTARDEFRAQTSSRTDIALTYTYRVPGAASTELFAKADLINVFDQAAIVAPFFLNQGVLNNQNRPNLYQAFNPFAESPVRGQHWDLAPEFGQPTSRFAYQTPRTFRASVGVRF
jgi:outer membrane receptor for ferrienterochelin and colicin